MPEAYRDLVNRVLRDHEGYTGDGRGSVGALPVGDRSTARKAIDKRDLREVILAGDTAVQTAVDAASTATAAADRAEAAMIDTQGATMFAADRAALLANSTTGIPAGVVFATREGGHSYRVVSSGGDLTTAGGVQLELLPTQGRYDFLAAGGDNTGANHATNLATLNRLLARLDPVKGGIILFPAGEWAFQGAAINQHGVVLQGSPGAVIKKTAPNTVPLTVGEATRAQGDRVRGFRAFDLTLDGGSHEDATDDYPGIYCRYVDDAVVERCNLRNFWGAGVRFGRGSLSWPVADQRSHTCRAINNTITNCGFGIELHGVADGIASLNTIKGGPLTNRSVSIAVRIVKVERAFVVGNNIDGMGRGIATSADGAGQQAFHLVALNNVTGCTYGPAYSSSGEIIINRVTNNTFVGSGSVQTQVCIMDGNGIGVPRELSFLNNHVEAAAAHTTDLVRIEETNGATVKGNTLRHRGTGATATRYGVRIVECDGLIDVTGNTLDMDGAGARGVWDVLGKASLVTNVSGNTVRMDIASGTIANFAARSSSAGTLRTGLNRFPDVGEYQVRSTDGGFSLTPFLSPGTTYVTAALAALREISLSSTTAYDGLEFTVVHRGSGNNLNLAGLKTLTPNTWATVQWAGTSWVLKAAGPL